MSDALQDHTIAQTDSEREVAWAMDFIMGQMFGKITRQDILKEAPTTVYVCRNEGNEVLYVGMTVEAHTRYRAHTKKAWWPYVATISEERFRGRASAVKREAALIAELKPKHNVRRRAIK